MVQKSLIVAVRVRPLLEFELRNETAKNILRVIDRRMVVVLDPDESKGYLDQLSNRSKERRYTFDYAFSTEATNRDIYDGTIKRLVSGILDGLNGTVFAYGATGSGKTHTMVGTENDPGLMVLSLEQIFKEKENRDSQEQIEVTCSYLEVYNEVIYDLLIKKSAPLELREDPSQGIQVAGLTRVHVKTAEHIMSLLKEGNQRRKTESTRANETSSRSHAVLEIVVSRWVPDRYRKKQIRGKLCLVDLAGSERAAETNNFGQKLRDGASINRSLLALANCINALGKKKKQGMAYVPYRNSKLTRLLKDGLSGNSATAMIATVAASSEQYNHSINTLKYADRAKEIKTHVVPNVDSIETHISDYRKIIDHLQAEVQNLRSKLDEKPSTASSVDDQLSWIDNLATEINENVEERINLQKALFELEDVNICNNFELKNVEDHLTATDLNIEEVSQWKEKRQNILDNIDENEEAGTRYRQDIEANEKSRLQIQERIEQGMSQYQNASFLKILSTFRLQAVRLQEFQFQMAIRDQIISEQRNVIKNLWKLLESSGMDKDAILKIAQSQGIGVEPLIDSEIPSPTAVGASKLLKLLDRQGMEENVPDSEAAIFEQSESSNDGNEERLRATQELLKAERSESEHLIERDADSIWYEEPQTDSGKDETPGFPSFTSDSQSLPSIPKTFTKITEEKETDSEWKKDSTDLGALADESSPGTRSDKGQGHSKDQERRKQQIKLLKSITRRAVLETNSLS